MERQKYLYAYGDDIGNIAIVTWLGSIPGVNPYCGNPGPAFNPAAPNGILNCPIVILAGPDAIEPGPIVKLGGEVG